MGKTAFLFFLILQCTIVNGQSTFHPTEKYMKISSTAERLYAESNFIKAALTYDTLFKIFKNNGYRYHKYDAACVWALTGNKDKAFFYLKQAIDTKEWVNLPNILAEEALDTLHSDERWRPFIDSVIVNNKIPESKLNKPLVSLLDSINKIDQIDRLHMDEIQNKYGMQSKEMDSLWRKIRLQDSSNLNQVKNIIDNLGWLGPAEIGQQGASTLFLVIQHADSATQVKYLPIMRAAVKKGKALPQNLALLKDRVLTMQKKKQLYGSQVGNNAEGKNSFLPITDETNVNKRRASVGLGPLEDYAKYFGINYVLPKRKK